MDSTAIFILLASVSAGVAILGLLFAVWRASASQSEQPDGNSTVTAATDRSAASSGDRSPAATTGGIAAGGDITVINQGIDSEAIKEVQQQLQSFSERLAQVEGAADIGTNELVKATDTDAKIYMRQALELQDRNKEREAIETLLTAYDKAMTPKAKTELHNLAGISFLRLSALQEAESHFKQALAAAQAGGSSDDVGAAMGNIALVLAERGELAEAERMHKRSLAISMEIGNELGEADTRGNLAFIELQRGNLNEAIELLRECLQIDQKLKNRRGEAGTLANMAIVQRHLGQMDEARSNLQRALSIRRGLQDRRGEAQVYAVLGTIHRQLGELKEAETKYKEALKVFRDVGSRADQAKQLGSLGVLHALRDQFSEAISLFGEALAIFLDIGNRLGEASSRLNLGLAAIKTGDFQHGCEELAKAAELYDSSDLPARADEIRAKREELGCEDEAQEPPASEDAPTD